jgi:flagellar hook-associated protein 3 FlgL
MINVSNTFRRIGVATATLEEVDNQLQTAQDTYIEEYNDHMSIDTYDAIVQMYQHMYSYNAAMQVGSKIMQNSLFDFVQ